MDPHANTAAAAKQLQEDCVAEFVGMDTNPPDTLYHYTDPRGLLGILDTKQFWFSQAGFLNDSTEVTHADQMIKSALKHQLANTSSQASRELLTRTLQSVDVFSTHSAGAFMACFCESGDLLSQWRGYGSSGGGFALGFDAKQLTDCLGKFVTDTAGIIKVIYDTTKQKNFVTGTIEKFCQLIESWEKAGWDPIGNNLLSDAHDYLELALADPYFRFKHPGFEEEREWRLVIFRKLDHSALKFRPAGTRIVPFFEIGMGMHPSGGSPNPLPLTQVVCGPTLNQEVSKQAIALRLDREYSKGSVKITSSSVPFRV